ncbi:MAG: tetratricopeptide repeat protein [Spirochaetes bacterium]|nr:tetratricopeptide repeat protein [Spirochaetota bacterium]
MNENPKKQEALGRAANALKLRDFATAEKLARQYLFGDPASVEARRTLGTVYLRTNRTNEALSAFSSVLERKPDDVRALDDIGAVYLRLGRPNDALTALERAAKLAPGDAGVHFSLGNVYRHMNNLRAAELSYLKAIELDPRNVLAYNNLGSVYLNRGDNEKAVQVFWKGLGVDHNYPSFHYNLGVAYEALGKNGDALVEYDKAVKARPGWNEAMMRYGHALVKAGQGRKAVELFEQVIAIEKDSAQARNGMGMAFAELGRVDDAVKCFREALETNPDFLDASVNIQRLLEQTGRYAEAVQEIRSLVDLMPDNDGLRLQLAELHRKLGDIDLALRETVEVLRRKPNDLAALKLYAALLQQSGQAEKSRSIFEKIVEMYPKEAEFRVDLAEIYIAEGRFDDAVAGLQDYLRMRPGNSRGRLAFARALSGRKDWQHAKQVLLEETRDRPDNAEAWLELSAVYRMLGEREKAVDAADKLVNLQGKRGKPEDIGDLEASLAEYEKAVNSYSQDVRDSWDRNLRVLKNLLAAEVKKTEAGPEEPTEEEKLEALLAMTSAEPIPIDEAEELLMLDEREEPLDEPDALEEPEGEEEDEEELRSFGGLVEARDHNTETPGGRGDDDRGSGADGRRPPRGSDHGPDYDEAPFDEPHPRRPEPGPERQEQPRQAPQPQYQPPPQYQQQPQYQPPQYQAPPPQIQQPQFIPVPMQMPMPQAPARQPRRIPRPPTSDPIGLSQPDELDEPGANFAPESMEASEGDEGSETGEPDEALPLDGEKPGSESEIESEPGVEIEPEPEPEAEGEPESVPEGVGPAEDEDGVEVEEGPEDVYGEAPGGFAEDIPLADEVPDDDHSGKPVPAGTPDGQPEGKDGNEPGQWNTGREAPGAGDGILDGSTADLFRYLKDLTGELPEDKRKELEDSGVYDMMDRIIKGLTGEEDYQDDEFTDFVETLEGAARSDTVGRKRVFDMPRDRRRVRDRRLKPERRKPNDRRNGSRRGNEAKAAPGSSRPKPAGQGTEPVTGGAPSAGALSSTAAPPPTGVPGAATAAPDSPAAGESGGKVDIMGVLVSPKVAKLIEIMKREKEHGGKR